MNDDEVSPSAFARLTGRSEDPIAPCGALPPRILVTGAGGSIGSSLVRLLLDRGVETITALDRDAVGLERLPDDPRLRRLRLDLLGQVPPVLDHGIDGVVHAAAEKEVGALESRPRAARRANVEGALVAARWARDLGATTFLQVSTDKAVEPKSVMGASKRLAEIELQREIDGSSLRAVILRLPNVLGSSASVLPLFAAALEHHRPLPVRDPAATRYFISAREAAAAIAAALALDGGIWTLGGGLTPRSIGALARAFADLRGRRPAWRVSGLEAGEKRHERLVGEGEFVIASAAAGRLLRVRAIDDEARCRDLLDERRSC